MSEDFNPDMITVRDEDGKEYQFEVIDAIEDDVSRYVALLPVYEEAADIIDNTGELVVLKVIEEDEEEVFITIEDDEEANRITDIFIERLSDLYEIEEE